MILISRLGAVDNVLRRNYNKPGWLESERWCEYGQRDGEEVSVCEMRHRADCHPGWGWGGCLLRATDGEKNLKDPFGLKKVLY